MIMTLTTMIIRVTPITIPATAPLFKPAEMYNITIVLKYNVSHTGWYHDIPYDLVLLHHPLILNFMLKNIGL